MPTSFAAATSWEHFLHGTDTGACFLFSPNASRTHYQAGLLFSDLQGELECLQAADIPRFFKALEKALDQGYSLAGYFTYELGYAFENIGKSPQAIQPPLAWLGVFAPSRKITQNQLKTVLAQSVRSRRPEYWLAPAESEITFAAYQTQIKKIKKYITAGDTYQVNYTFPLRSRLVGNAGALFLDLYQTQPVGYAGMLRGGNKTILSLSPELFFQRHGRQLQTKPMKGTAARTGNEARDVKIREQLLHSKKNRAENVMIVDLLRNDLGRICETGSILTTDLFHIENYSTVYQMTSTVTGKLQKRNTWLEVFKNIYPCGSVTGAPKIRTMQIIAELEKHNRGVYTGAFGFITPQKKAVFNVPIRTLEINPRTCDVRVGIGSGIVADSEASSEWEESHVKARFVRLLERDYHLIETMRWDTAAGYADLKQHLHRLRVSAQFFKIPWKRKSILTKLEKAQRVFKENKQTMRIRLLLFAAGTCRVEVFPVIKQAAGKTRKIQFSRFQTQSRNIFLYHKTSNRELYNAEYSRAQKRGFVDVLFTNEKGAVTEGCVTNVYLKKKGCWYTPPVTAGLLPGIERQKLLRQKKLNIQEKTLFSAELGTADEIRLSNSVRGWFTVTLES
ncbi:aminodeoxychorismate synthase component I [bacterium]|nr:aminodeoxychorismate synthase component I [bacterium]